MSRGDGVARDRQGGAIAVQELVSASRCSGSVDASRGDEVFRRSRPPVVCSNRNIFGVCPNVDSSIEASESVAEGRAILITTDTTIISHQGVLKTK